MPLTLTVLSEKEKIEQNRYLIESIQFYENDTRPTRHIRAYATSKDAQAQYTDVVMMFIV